MNFIGIIPARYASTRFPGKPLAIVGGKPMIQRVYEQATKALETVVVATDDERIMNCVQRFGGNAVMTSPDHPCGTNRCYEAYRKLRYKDISHTDADYADDVIINIQGDEPFIEPSQIEILKSCFPTDIATLVTPFRKADGIEALLNPNSPKVVMSQQQTEDGNNHYRALMFSRSVIPYYRGIAQEKWLEEAERRKTPFWKHIGMYAYRADVLQRIVALPMSALEKAESLEQLRWLEAGYEIRAAITEHRTIGIDTPEDLKKANLNLCY